MNRFRTFAVIGTLLAAAVVAQTDRARACEHEIELDVNYTAGLLAKAERNLRAGKPHWAFKKAWLVVEDTDPENMYVNEDQQALLHARALRIAAVATARRGGKVSRRYGVSVKRATAAERAENLAWAATTMKKLLAAAKKPDPSLRAHYAEVIATQPSGRAEARRILADLARRDLMPDAWAYRTLAELAHDAGDATSRDAALGRCEVIAGKRHASLCRGFLAEG